ncbi:minor capsid protein [Metaclostridioides mangenotii]|uniref:SPP1 gp7 family putative phage head morphogenesis protein n=1 Tax=Metaclostridioides mangenotii TaxID=1540 RepID=A0ABS4E9S3_9FIRM|nr:minor capsid protein [Clostridioides mangenotii]MBP1854661.1 SPP1 gp7 family putative phage head morphogenesis protein [Clostridioides mangenotii]
MGNKSKIKARNSKYWHDRFVNLELARLNKSKKIYREIEKEYIKAIRNIEKDISKWYIRFAENNSISFTEAKRLLSSKELDELRWDIKEYISIGRENAVNEMWIKELENASAKYHITRLDSLKLQMQQHLEVLFGNELDSVDKLIRDTYSSGYYHTAFEIAKGTEIAVNLVALDTNKIEMIISRPWTSDGTNFSKRIWGERRPELINYLNKELTHSIIRGENPKKLISKMAKKFNTSKSRAGNLIMTESAFFASASRKDCFEDLDVEKYEVISTLDFKTSEICQDMDGKIFDMKDYDIGSTAPPFHPRCRTTTAPYFDDEIGERAARGKDGKVYYVPSNVSYSEWYKKYVK